MRNQAWCGLTVWAAVALMLLGPIAAPGQCPGGTCPTIVRRPQVDSAQPQRPTPAWRYERAAGHRAAVARIVCYDRDGSKSIGSGVLVRYRGRLVILTAWHVIQTARRITVWLATGRWYDARVLHTDSTWDCGVLDIGRPQGVEPAELEFGDAAHPGRSDRLESAGYGGDGRLAVNTGFFLGYSSPSRSGGPADWMRLSGYARQGDSGGPIFNARGRVVGILWGTNGREVVGTQAGRLHRILAAAVEKLPIAETPAAELAEQKRLPLCRPFTPVPQPAPSVVVRGDPAVGRALESIDAKLDVIAANTAAQAAPRVEPATAGLSPLLVGLVISISVVLAFVGYFGTQKG